MTRYLASFVVVAVLAAGVAFYVISRDMTDPAPAVETASAPPAETQAAAAPEPTVETASVPKPGIDVSTVQEMAIGAPDAPVTVIEYASFTCPHCARFHDTVFEELKKAYVDTGKVRFVYREVYFDRYGLWASMVARCGGEMRFFGLADLIYAQQAEWAKGEPAEIAANLRRIGKTAGLTEEQLDACFADQAKAETLVAWFRQNAETDGIESTPSFLVNGVRHSNMSFEDFAKVIDAAIAG
jgi:protein-disulfide isomerase